MTRLCAVLIGLVLPAATLADGASGQDLATTDCGGPAYTFAEVVTAEESRRHRGPLIAVPDTLCADLPGNPTRIDSLNIYLDPRGNTAGQPQSSAGFPGTPAMPFRRF